MFQIRYQHILLYTIILSSVFPNSSVTAASWDWQSASLHINGSVEVEFACQFLELY